MTKIRKWGRLPDLAAVAKRFPVAVMLMGLMALLFITEGYHLFGRNEWEIAAGLILGGYLCVGLQLADESRGSRAWTLPAKIIAAVLSVVLAIFMERLAFNIFAAVMGAIVFLGNFAFRGRGRDDGRVWLFTQKLWTGAIFAFVGSIIFTIGVFAIIATANALFGISMDSLVEHLILPVGLAFLAPVYWMGTLPDPRDAGECSEDLSFEARALAFLGTWLLAPLTLIYGLIILAYAVRILVTMSLPSGEIAQLVTPFIAVGTLTWLVLEPKMMPDGGFVRFYRKVWFPIMVVATALLLVSVLIRIGEYGLTPERFMLLAFGAASLIISLWFVFRRASDIRIPTAVAAGFFALTAFVGKPASDLHQLARAKSGLTQLDTVEGIMKAREGTLYLARNDREDWADNLFPDNPREDGQNWQAFLDEQNIMSDEYRKQNNARENWSNVNYEIGSDMSLAATPNLIGRYNVNFRLNEEQKTISPSVGGILVRDDSLFFLFDGETVESEIGDVFQTLFEDRPTRSSSYDPGYREVVGTPSFEVTLPDGRAGRILILTLGLNGEGLELKGGYGEALIFSE